LKMLKAKAISSRGDLHACLERMNWGRGFRSALMGSPDSDPIPYAGPLLDAVSLFEGLKIGYALVGGVAAMYYGRARFTEDLDFVAASGHMRVLEQNPGAMKSCHFDPASTWKLYHESGLEIDLWKDEHADEIVARAQAVPLAGHLVKIAAPVDLVAMKLRAGRIQDDYDISEIVRAMSLDEEILRSHVTQAQFEHFLSIRQRTR
jgi:hypothetical protein